MFQTAAGVTVPYPEKLSEQYLREGNTITANLSFEKLCRLHPCVLRRA